MHTNTNTSTSTSTNTSTSTSTRLEFPHDVLVYIADEVDSDSRLAMRVAIANKHSLENLASRLNYLNVNTLSHRAKLEKWLANGQINPRVYKAFMKQTPRYRLKPVTTRPGRQVPVGDVVASLVTRRPTVTNENIRNILNEAGYRPRDLANEFNVQSKLRSVPIPREVRDRFRHVLRDLYISSTRS